MKNEKVLSVELTRLRQSFDLSRQYWPIDVAVLNRLSYGYADRSQAEADFSCKQLIPYALIFDQNGRICNAAIFQPGLIIEKAPQLLG